LIHEPNERSGALHQVGEKKHLESYENEFYQTGKYSIVEVLEDEPPINEKPPSRVSKLPGINKSKKSAIFSQTGKSSSE